MKIIDNKKQGFIKLYRSFLDWRWFSDSDATKLYLYCLLNANYQNDNYAGVNIQKGEFITSIRELSFKVGMSRGRVSRTLIKLQQTKDIIIKTKKQYTLIFVVEFEKYQTFDRRGENRKNNQNIKKSEPLFEPLFVDSETLKSEPQSEPQAGQFLSHFLSIENTQKVSHKVSHETLKRIDDSSKELKNNINNKEEKKYIIINNNIQRKEEKEKIDFEKIDTWGDLIKCWDLNKNGKRYKNQTSLKMALNKLQNLSGTNIDTAKKIIEQSLANNWIGLFQLQEDKNNNNLISRAKNFANKDTINNMGILRMLEENIND